MKKVRCYYNHHKNLLSVQEKVNNRWKDIINFHVKLTIEDCSPELAAYLQENGFSFEKINKSSALK